MDRSHHHTYGNLQHTRKKNLKGDGTTASSSSSGSRKRHSSSTCEEPPTKISTPRVNFSTTRRLNSNVNECSDSYPCFESFRQNLKHKLLVTKEEGVSNDVNLLTKIQSIYQNFSNRFPNKPIHFNQNKLFAILSHAKICPGSHILIFEESEGFITAAAMLLLKGEGKLHLISKNLTSQRFPVLQAMDFSNEINVLSPIRLSTITKEISSDSSNNFETTTNKYIDDESMDFEEHSVKSHRLEWVHEKLNFPSPFHSLIIASATLSPVNILQQFYRYLCTAGTVVVCTNVEEEAQMIHAFLIAHKAMDIQVCKMTNATHFSQNSHVMDFVINARKAK